PRASGGHVMRRIGLLTTALVGVAVLLTAACSDTAAGPAANAGIPVAAAADGTQQVTLTVAATMAFEPSSITVHAGQPVELTLQNTGQNQHDFSLGSGANQPVKITAEGGQTASGTFTIDKPGTYSFECSVPGHAMLGMRGTITAV